MLIEQHGGEVPVDRDILETLPGVGRKTANVVLNVAFAHPTLAVDTHIFRVCNRTGLAPGKTPRAVEDGLEKVVPPERKLHAHHWLILHGRYVCKARKPDCPACLINDICRYKAKTVDLSIKNSHSARLDSDGARNRGNCAPLRHGRGCPGHPRRGHRNAARDGRQIGIMPVLTIPL